MVISRKVYTDGRPDMHNYASATFRFSASWQNHNVAISFIQAARTGPFPKFWPAPVVDRSRPLLCLNSSKLVLQSHLVEHRAFAPSQQSLLNLAKAPHSEMEVRLKLLLRPRKAFHTRGSQVT